MFEDDIFPIPGFLLEFRGLCWVSLYVFLDLFFLLSVILKSCPLYLFHPLRSIKLSHPQRLPSTVGSSQTFLFLSSFCLSPGFSYSFFLMLLPLGTATCCSTAVFSSLSITALTGCVATTHLSYWTSSPTGPKLC